MAAFLWIFAGIRRECTDVPFVFWNAAKKALFARQGGHTAGRSRPYGPAHGWSNVDERLPNHHIRGVYGTFVA